MKRSILILVISFGLATSLAEAAPSAPILPNSTATPGASNPAVSQANIGSTICVLGYTTKIRPSTSYTTSLKIKQLASAPYSSYASKNTALFEEDHLIPLELGGNPTDPKNLWPEPWDGPYGARVKDTLENKLHALVCAHQLSLTEAQSAFTSNWYISYQNYVLGTASKASPSPSPIVSQLPTPQKILACPADFACTIGSRGPGGGIIFYIASSPQPWGQYLEAAPAGWAGGGTDPKAAWCKRFDPSQFDVPQNPDRVYSPTTSGTIGTGKASTDFAVAICPGDAAARAKAYQGGGKSDWYLPSTDELKQLYANRDAVGGFYRDSYWSSSGGNGSFASDLDFSSGVTLIISKFMVQSVRPIRAF